MLAAVLLVLALAVAAVLPREGTHFRGRTEQGQAVSFSVSTGPRRLQGLALNVSATCRGFGSAAERRVFPPIRLNEDGTFSGISRDVPPRISPQGDLVWILGRFDGPRRARGTIRLLARRYDSPVGYATCTSPRIVWTATAK